VPDCHHLAVRAQEGSHPVRNAIVHGVLAFVEYLFGPLVDVSNKRLETREDFRILRRHLLVHVPIVIDHGRNNRAKYGGRGRSRLSVLQGRDAQCRAELIDTRSRILLKLSEPIYGLGISSRCKRSLRRRLLREIISSQ
jgi:hypothetical protein